MSPRVGFTYSQGNWSLRGGIGEFRGRLPVSATVGAGFAAGQESELVCTGPGTPTPQWNLFAVDPTAVPTACADGAPVFSSRGPRLTLFDPGFAAPRTWHGSLGWGWGGARTRLGNVGVHVELDWIRGSSQPLAYDRNLDGVAEFQLDAEGGRPVYVPASTIDPATGAAALGASRRDSALGIVRLVSAGGRSDVVQLSAGMSLLTRGLSVWAVDYTFTRSRDEVSPLAPPAVGSGALAGLASTRASGGTSDLERRHLVQLQWVKPFTKWKAEVGVIGRLMSGAPYTPRVGGDVDGDGAANDRAFVFDPTASPDPTVARGIERLLATAPSGTRECLRRNLDRLAVRNSCRTPWTATLDLQASFWPGQAWNARRFTVSVTARNVLAGLDRALHGEDGLRGWGLESLPDPTLLYIRGFDPGVRRYAYEVNPGFGSGRGRNLLGEPFTLTIQGRWTLGVDPVQQPLRTLVGSIRVRGRSVDQIRNELRTTIPNLPMQVLALDDTLGLGLSTEQRTQLRSAAESAGGELAVIADSLARAVSEAETGLSAERTAARKRIPDLSARAKAALDRAVERVRQILTETQWMRLPRMVREPARQLVSDQEITLPAGEP